MVFHSLKHPATRLDRAIDKKQELRSLDVQVYSLPRGQMTLPAHHGEQILILLTGTARIHCGTTVFRKVGGRKSIFRGKPEAVYLPANQSAIIDAASTVTVAIGRSALKPKKPKHTAPFVIRSRTMRVERRGIGGYRRRVTPVLNEMHGAEYLLAGETLSAPGKWSSYPPHKHDRNRGQLENNWQEIYYFRVSRKGRFGFQALYRDDSRKDQALRIMDHDKVMIQDGYHPVAAPPDAWLYYLWILCGRHRNLRFATEPGFN